MTSSIESLTLASLIFIEAAYASTGEALKMLLSIGASFLAFICSNKAVKSGGSSISDSELMAESASWWDFLRPAAAAL